MRTLLVIAFAVLTGTAGAEDMKLAVTTSFHNSGLAEILLPAITEDTGIDVQLLVVGTGQAIRLGEAGDVDAILVHARKAEDAFVKDGFGTHRTEIMYNDFVLVGPADDPAGIVDAESAVNALSDIAATRAAFVSRGDDSGTHKMELTLWDNAGIAPEGDWYRAVGAGMGAALNTASGMGAYVLADRASWLNFGNKGDLLLHYSGDPALFNQYAYIPVNPETHTAIRHDLATQVEAWLISDRAKTLIDGYEIADQKLFTFNAKAP